MGNTFIYGGHLIDDKTLEQFNDCMDAPYAVRGALMPDAHFGYSMPIGGVMDAEDVIVPAYVGYDIGCGMLAVLTSYNVEQLRAAKHSIYTNINDYIPTGFKRHEKHAYAALDIDTVMLGSSWFQAMWIVNNGDFHLGTMGGNNHYIEIGEDNFGKACIAVHSGSRGIGHKTATHYMKIAGDGKCREGNYPLHNRWGVAQRYWNDMNVCLEFAKLNRLSLVMQVEDVLDRMGFRGKVSFDTAIDSTHNIAETLPNGLVRHRKGATKIATGVQSVVAGNPVAGTFIVRGKQGRPESLDSSSHGMGRTKSRKQANKDITNEEVKDMMGDVAGHIKREEAPSAYKSPSDVMDAQSDLIEIVNQIHPFVCLKG